MDRADQLESSDRMLITQSMHNAKQEIKLESDLDLQGKEEEIDRRKVKQVDTSNPSWDEDQLHMGILEQEDSKGKECREADREILEMQISSMALNEAVAQRKAINFKILSNYMQQHAKYYGKHIDILAEVETQVRVRLQREREFMSESLNYFYALSQAQLNSQLAPSLADIFRVQDNTSTYGRIMDTLKNLIIIRNDFEKSTGSSSNWVVPDFITKLSNLNYLHESSTQYYLNELTKIKPVVDEKLKAMSAQYKQIQNLVLFGDHNKQVDMLHQELTLFQNSAQLKAVMAQWGQLVNTLWTMSQKGEMNVITPMRQQITAVFQNIAGLFDQNSKFQSAQVYWLSVDCEVEIQKQYSLELMTSAQHQKFILQNLCKQKLEDQDLQRLASLNHETRSIGSIQQIKSTLILKKFNCKTSDKQPAKNIYIYSTVDGFMIFTIQESDKPVNFMDLRATTCKRLTQHTVEVKEKKPGFFGGSWNTQQIQFGTSDEAEEFLMFLAQSQEERDSVIN